MQNSVLSSAPSAPDAAPSQPALSPALIAACIAVACPFVSVALSFAFRHQARHILPAAALGLVTLAAPLVGAGLSVFAFRRGRSIAHRLPVVLAVLGLLVNAFFVGALIYVGATHGARVRATPWPARPHVSPGAAIEP